MKKSTLLTLAILASFLVKGQSFSDFDAIDVFGPFKVSLVPDGMEKVEIDYNGVDRDDVLVEERHGCVYVKMRSKHYFDDLEWAQDHIPTVYLTIHYKKLSELRVEAGARVESDSPINIATLFLSCTMGGIIDVSVKAEKVVAESSTGAELFLDGTTNRLELTTRMGAQVHAGRLQSKSAYVRSTMGAQADVTATQEIDASAGFGGVISYGGGASAQHTNTTFGGEISGF